MDFTCILPAWFPGFGDAPNFGVCFGSYIFSKSVLVPLVLPESLPNNFVSEVYRVDCLEVMDGQIL